MNGAKEEELLAQQLDLESTDERTSVRFLPAYGEKLKYPGESLIENFKKEVFTVSHNRER